MQVLFIATQLLDVTRTSMGAGYMQMPAVRESTIWQLERALAKKPQSLAALSKQLFP